MGQPANTAAQGGGATLTPEQWQGLAQLGGMLNALGNSFNGGMSAAVAGGVRRAGDIYERYELPELLEELLATGKALRDSGLLALIRDNAKVVVETIQLLAPLAPRLVAALQTMPTGRWRQHLATADRLLAQAHALSQFVDGKLAGELTELIVKLTALDQETDAMATTRDLLRLVARLRANGTLARLTDISDHLAAFAETTDVGALMGDLTQTGGAATAISLRDAVRTCGVLVKAVQDAQRHPSRDQVGGLRGLIRLLKDPAVQRGILLATRVSSYVETKNGAPRAPAA